MVRRAAGAGFFFGLLGLMGVWLIKVVGQEARVPFVPTPMEVVAKMLEVAQVKKGDVVYDLGCGDGRIVVMAAQKFGARSVGVDIKEERVRESLENVRKANVEHLVVIRQEDLFKTDLTDATVVTLYLLSSVNLELRPKLFRELKLGARVVSHAFDMGEWEPDKKVEVTGRTVYFWVMPAGVAGIWRWASGTSARQTSSVLRLQQHFQKLSGTYTETDGTKVPIADAKIVGDQLSFTVTSTIGGQTVKRTYDGKVNGDAIKGTVKTQGGPFAGKREWMAKRDAVNLVGTWHWTLSTPIGEFPGGLLVQRQKEKNWLAATYTAREREIELPNFIALGASVMFEVELETPEGNVTLRYRGFVEGDTITGTVTSDRFAGERRWSGKRG